jgi:hypothetical protein
MSGPRAYEGTRMPAESIHVSLLVAALAISCCCCKTPNEFVPARALPVPGGATPVDVVKGLLAAIEQEDWRSACNYLSPRFLAKHRRAVLRGRHFRSDGGKRTAFYTSRVWIRPRWREEDDGHVAIVTLNTSGTDPQRCIGVCAVKLSREQSGWRVDEF